MRRKNTIFLSILLLYISYIGHSQVDTSSDQVTKTYTDYFELPRESVFLHLNKSTYIAGEDIWFKGYIYDRQKEKPFTATSTLRVGIYDSIGNHITTQKSIVYNGYTQGSFPLDSTFANGTYYIKAYTNWMRNFKEDDAYIQKITIYNKTITKNIKKGTPTYDIQFLPEGGNLISDINNTIGVKVINQYGKGVPFKTAVIKDASNTSVVSFKSSKYGLAKFDFAPSISDNYTAEFTFEDGSTVIKKLPKPVIEGVTMSVRPYGKKQLAVFIKTNESTLRRTNNREFTIFIHRDGHAKSFEAKIPEGAIYGSFLVDRSILLKGMNIITLFNDKGQPISERLFFNTYNLQNPFIESLSVTPSISKKDSLEVSLTSYTKDTLFKNISISVLPSNTKSYKHQNTILSTFYLKPYLKGTIENPAHYFKLRGSSQEEALDLLLLTQGWSRYVWPDIFNNTPRKLFDFESGMSLKGQINTEVHKKDQLYLHPSTNVQGQVLDITDNRFTINQIFPLEKDTIKLSFIRKNGKMTVPKLYITSDGLLTENSIDVSKNDVELVASSQENSSVEEIPEFSKEKNVTELNEVVLSGKKRPETKDSGGLPSFISGRAVKVTPEILTRGYFFTDIIRSQGYNVIVNPSLFGVRIFTRTQRSIIGVTQPSPLIFIDRVQQVDFDRLYNLRTEDVESYFFDRIGTTAGSRGSAGVIYISLRKNVPYSQRKSTKKAYSFPISDGYTATKQFYNPVYINYDNKAFENYGTIHWEPEIIIDKQGKATFTMTDTGTEKISFFIEGMGSDGKLFSTVKTVQVPYNNQE